ncbi:histidinol-phosphatase HisJ [Jeotgalibacillus haloalkalitolerans]|uniref:Histidinol-phosphatase n=1 Tax=Jeotgalibacillus haloalkalitolerans TaxID=3104292 RepID=A0ABU5KP67_9BACL|nr:histidinol-phosphatase HisJ [Jeotgalibacillus sp. HH7-29]MDZ5712485.1 histidinol-phosphatase HisJ [Jeotgalibacillus sp. HH7-29]
MIVKDGHIHTPYCPHGSGDSLTLYVEKAIEAGLKEITFTEHAPLPQGFHDPVPEQDSGMNPADLENYLRDVEKVKHQYKKDLRIHTGLEVDYIEGFEKETRDFLNQYGPHLDDSILSVHFLKASGQYICLDYSPEAFKALIDLTGSADAVHSLYYDTVIRSVHADLGSYKPARIGHITLSRKFQRLYPALSSHETEIKKLLEVIKARDLELDYNGAGTVKPYCQETYPSPAIASAAHQMGIRLVYGSDAHTASGMMQGSDQLIALKP